MQLHDLFDDVGDEIPPPAGQDVSADQWLRSKGATPLQLEVAGVCYANDFGCSLQQLGLREMITENQRCGKSLVSLQLLLRVLIPNTTAAVCWACQGHGPNLAKLPSLVVCCGRKLTTPQQVVLSTAQHVLYYALLVLLTT